jgi:hypothetical protein
VVDGRDNVEFKLAVGRSSEDACVNLDLFDARTVELAKGSDYAGFLACAGGPVD